MPTYYHHQLRELDWLESEEMWAAANTLALKQSYCLCKEMPNVSCGKKLDQRLSELC